MEYTQDELVKKFHEEIRLLNDALIKHEMTPIKPTDYTQMFIWFQKGAMFMAEKFNITQNIDK